MLPSPWSGFLRGFASFVVRALLGPCGQAEAVGHPERWHAAAVQRRRLLLASVLASTAAATWLFVSADRSATLLSSALFALLFGWVVAGFITALMGLRAQLAGDAHALAMPSAREPLPLQARTAIVMPICNESIATVFGGLRATCASLAATGAMRLFDVFVLSDSTDPAVRAAEIAAWRQLRESLGDDGGAGGGHIYYRWRRRRTRRKAGNVADFCRRWGCNYRYMVVLDADSVMTGECLTALVRLMEAHPRAGIIQTAPRAVGHATLHARAQNFAARLTGPLLARGMAWWQLGDSHYWGHNAILRMQPFMRHCALAPLRGRGGLAGDILSHDFVEAALMRRAGYEVWLAPDLDGSYEQQPANLLDELQRDRRWCQGNLQNARLIAEPRLRAAHRAMFAVGAMAYVAAALWLAFVALGIAHWFGAGAQAPAGAALALWGATLAMLLLPRALGVACVLRRGDAGLFGGPRKLVESALFETLLSTLQAPVRMAAHTLFVVSALTGLRIDWKSPAREAASVRWGDALRHFGPLAVVALAACCAIALTLPQTLPLLALIVLPLALAAPLAVWTGRSQLGEAMRRRGVLLVPEEIAAPPVLRRAAADTAAACWADPATGSLEADAASAPADALPMAARSPRRGFARAGRWAAAASVALMPVAVPLSPHPVTLAIGPAPQEAWIVNAPIIGESLSSLVSPTMLLQAGERLVVRGSDALPAVRPRR